MLKTGYGTVKGGIYAGATGSGAMNSGVVRDYAYMFALFGALCAVSLILDVFKYYTGEYDVAPWAVGALMLLRVFSAIPWVVPVIYNQQLRFVSTALRRQNIVCIDQQRIAAAGALQVCCFDKTGTLTESSMNVDGLVGIHRGQERPISYEKALDSTKLVLALCHTLVDENDGDKLEQAMFQHAKGCAITGPNGVQVDGVGAFNKIKVFPFHAELKYMSVVASDETSNTAWVLAKGDPVKISSLLHTSPKNYHQVANSLASRGFRVLALASRKIQQSEGGLDDISREAAETGLSFDAFLCLDNALKPCTKDALVALKRSRHQLKMITGDHVLTALHVANSLDFFPTEEVKILLCENPEKGLSLVSREAYVTEEAEEEKEKSSWRAFLSGRKKLDLRHVLKTRNLAVTGKALAHLVEHYDRRDVVKVCNMATVFARVKPSQKETIIRAIKASEDKPNCLMCGDGLNDIRALSAASVGVALSAAAAPPTAKSSDGPTSPRRLSSLMRRQPRKRKARRSIVHTALDFRQIWSDTVNGVILLLRGMGRKENWLKVFEMDKVYMAKKAIGKVEMTLSMVSEAASMPLEKVVEDLDEAARALAEVNAKKDVESATVLSTGHFRCVGESVEGVTTIVRSGRAMIATLVYRYNLVFVRQVVGRAAFFLFSRDHLQLSVFTSAYQILLRVILNLFSNFQMFKPAKILKGKPPQAFSSERNREYIWAQATVQLLSMVMLKVLVSYLPEDDAPEIPDDRSQYVEPSLTNTIYYCASLAFYINQSFALVPSANLDTRSSQTVMILKLAVIFITFYSGILRLHPIPLVYKLPLLALIGFNTVGSWGLRQ